MPTLAQTAIAISILSLLVSGVSLGWNIYRDVALKGRLKVYFGVRLLITPGQQAPPPEFLMFSSTNHGPGSVKVEMLVLKNSSWWRRLLRKTKHAVLTHDYTNPLSGRVPSSIAVGDTLQLVMTYDNDCFLGHDWSHIGISDSFGRVHWAPLSHVNEARARFKKDFHAA
jgi:hypothetical protein